MKSLEARQADRAKRREAAQEQKEESARILSRDTVGSKDDKKSTKKDDKKDDKK